MDPLIAWHAGHRIATNKQYPVGVCHSPSRTSRAGAVH